MTRKLLLVLIAALIGSAVGGALGYGPLLRYKSEGVLAMDLTPAEYKRISESANAPTSLREALDTNSLPDLEASAGGRLEVTLSRGGWHSPLPKLSTADAKQIPPALLANLDSLSKATETEDPLVRLEAERALMPYLGLRLTYVAADPITAGQIANWLGDYIKDVAVGAMLRDQVAQWRADGRQFADYAVLRRQQFAFSREQTSARSKALQTLIASYPEAMQRDVSQVVDVRSDNAKYTTPLAQMVAAEREIIDIDESVRLLEREVAQEAFALPLVAAAEEALRQARTGRDAVQRVSEVFIAAAGDASNDPQRERLAAMSAQVSQLAARFLSRPHFIAAPPVPTVPERPGPHLIIVLGGVLAALLAAAWLWRDLLRRVLLEDEGTEQGPGRMT